jgi:hypothetical protein
MTTEEFAKICDWDRKCTAPEEVMFGTTKDRRRLIEYVLELQAALAIANTYLNDLYLKQGNEHPSGLSILRRNISRLLGLD